MTNSFNSVRAHIHDFATGKSNVRIRQVIMRSSARTNTRRNNATHTLHRASRFSERRQRGCQQCIFYSLGGGGVSLANFFIF